MRRPPLQHVKKWLRPLFLRREEAARGPSNTSQGFFVIGTKKQRTSQTCALDRSDLQEESAVVPVVDNVFRHAKNFAQTIAFVGGKITGLSIAGQMKTGG